MRAHPQLRFQINDPAFSYPDIPSSISYFAVNAISIAMGFLMLLSDMFLWERRLKRVVRFQVGIQIAMGMLEACLWTTVMRCPKSCCRRRPR